MPLYLRYWTFILKLREKWNLLRMALIPCKEICQLQKCLHRHVSWPENVIKSNLSLIPLNVKITNHECVTSLHFNLWLCVLAVFQLLLLLCNKQQITFIAMKKLRENKKLCIEWLSTSNYYYSTCWILQPTISLINPFITNKWTETVNVYRKFHRTL